MSQFKEIVMWFYMHPPCAVLQQEMMVKHGAAADAGRLRVRLCLLAAIG